VTDLLQLLLEFHREKLAILTGHEAGARSIAQYDANNAYQYIINREETHLSWLASAIVSLEGTPETSAPEAAADAGRGRDAWRELAEADARDVQKFVDRWRPRVEAMTNARHRGMLRVILGEMLEQKRFFEQVAAGNLDLLGRRPDAVGPRVGEVLPTRWVE
jgi:rubrerythrin